MMKFVLFVFCLIGWFNAIFGQVTRLPNNYRSKCFTPSFEQRYNNFGSHAAINFGASIFIDERHSRLVTARKVRQTIAAMNPVLSTINMQLSDIQVYSFPANLAQQPAYPADRFALNTYVANVMRPRWKTYGPLRDAIRAGRFVVLFSEMRDSSNSQLRIGGNSPVAMLHPTTSDPYVWMNINPSSRGGYHERSVLHEIGHFFGLFHTFEANKDICRYGDLIPDTKPCAVTHKGCGYRATNPCTGQSERVETDLLMSYGTCNGGKRITSYQYRRLRCVLEHATSLRPISGRRGSASQRAPTPAPASAPAPSGRVRSWGACNGIFGVCIEERYCPGNPISGRCPGPGAVKCCQQVSVQSDVVRGPLPGVGEQCIGIAGTCQDIDASECSTGGGFVRFKCPGPHQVQCCPSGAPDAEASVSPLSVVVDNEVPFPDLIEISGTQTFHIGDTLTLELPVEIEAVGSYRAYLWPTETLTKPADSTVMLQHGIALASLNTTHIAVKFTTLLDNSPVDRGQYAVVFDTLELESREVRRLVSTVFTVDADSCALDADALSTYGVAYAIRRHASACSERGGVAVGAADANGLVCCVPPLEQVDVAPPAPLIHYADNTTEAPVDESALESMSFDAQATVEWRGETVFWGMPMTLNVASAPTSTITMQLSALSGDAAEPDAAEDTTVTLPAAQVGAKVTLTPRVKQPGVYLFRNDDVQTDSFWVVPLPCRTSDNQAGYCQPTSDIVNGAKVNQDYELPSACSNGAAAPCAHLAIGSTRFACCAGDANDLQRQAKYRASQDTMTLPSSSSRLAPLLAVAVALALF